VQDVAEVAIRAARAMDEGLYPEVRSLYEGLLAEGHDQELVLSVFCSEGANPDNIPTQSKGGCYMHHATRDPAFG